MQLILVRHGLPERQEVANGRADPPLSATGLQQAERVAQWLSAIRIDAVYSSPMLRARQTAEPYTTLSGYPLQLHEGVEEFGDSLRYIPMEELKEQDYAAWKALANGEYASRVDLDTFSGTVVAATEEIIGTHRGQTVVVFCHGGVINVWASHVLGLGARLFFEPAYTSVHRFLCAGSGERNVASLNETAHLRDIQPTLYP